MSGKEKNLVPESALQHLITNITWQFDNECIGARFIMENDDDKWKDINNMAEDYQLYGYM